MQHNRPQIQKELGGDGIKPKDVAEEGTRRWGNMSDVEKSVCSPLAGSKPHTIEDDAD